jgi:uncharacterized repeat protein (TIGR03803 family)
MVPGKQFSRRLAAPVFVVVVLLLCFVLAPDARAEGKYKTLYRFTGGSDGGSLQTGLIFDSAGNLYGTTYSGGAYGDGVVFELTPNADGNWTENVLHQFTGGKDGGGPTGLMFDQSGNLYGTTWFGGTSKSSSGTVFKLTPKPDGSWVESVLYSFTDGNDGATPQAGVIFDQAGDLYGTTISGGPHGQGVVFRLAQNANGGWTESVLHHFCSLTNCSDGLFPSGSLIFDANGNLYGTTAFGGTNDHGIVFKLTPNADGGWTESVLHDFCSLTNCSDGFGPRAGLIFDVAGNLYGAAIGGGGHGDGVVFELTPNPDGTWTEKVLYGFVGKRGISPGSNLIFDVAGNLYGTTTLGGDPSYCTNDIPPGCGVVFKLTPNSKGLWRERVLHTFLDHPGALPLAGVIFDNTGNLYGTTAGDNTATNGSVFEIMP